MPQGSVKWFNNRRGYGFILAEQGRDVFVHYSAIEDPGARMLHEGDIVQYELVDTPRGPAAAHVHREQTEALPGPASRDA